MSIEAVPCAGIPVEPRGANRLGLAGGVARAWEATVPYLALVKLRIVLAIQLVAAASAFIAAGGWPPAGRLALLLAAGALASAGASALNHYLDRDLDALMERTRRRPLPAGKIGRPRRAAFFGAALLLASAPVSLVAGWPVTVCVLLGAASYVLVYTWWLKRRTDLNVVIGGIAGSMAALGGWLSVSAPLSPLAGLVAALVFLWTPLHFWNFALANMPDYRRAGVPMLPVVVGEGRARRYVAASAVAVLLCSLAPWALGYLGSLYLACALALGMLLRGNLQLGEGAARAWRNYKLSGVYLVGILAAAMLDISF